eukprot:5589784-Prymnesium_polylepis.1
MRPSRARDASPLACLARATPRTHHPAQRPHRPPCSRACTTGLAVGGSHIVGFANPTPQHDLLSSMASAGLLGAAPPARSAIAVDCFAPTPPSAPTLLSLLPTPALVPDLAPAPSSAAAPAYPPKPANTVFSGRLGLETWQAFSLMRCARW